MLNWVKSLESCPSSCSVEILRSNAAVISAIERGPCSSVAIVRSTLKSVGTIAVPIAVALVLKAGVVGVTAAIVTNAQRP